jgi:multicomponent Na+:H+ antiporter subunit D
MSGSFLIPPAAVLILGGVLLPFLRGHLRSAVLLLAPLLTLYCIWQVPDGVALQAPFLSAGLALVQGDALSRLFATVFALAAVGGGLYALNQSRTVELAAAFVYAGSAIGVVFAGDLITVFIFWEFMAVASALVIFSAGESAYGAGLRYAAIHFFGGVLLMAGVAGEAVTTGQIGFRAMTLDSWPRVLMLAGFLVNAGAWPLSAWIGDAYPRASWSGMVFLSAFTTKTAVYVLLRGFPGAELLIVIGLVMVFYGIVYAILESDMRRLLAYSIVSQVGFMVTAIGIGTPLALNGAAAHAFAHIVYKALLLMAAGSVLNATGKSNLRDLGGLWRAMPLTCACAIVGALSISALPLTSGFVSKAMIAQAAGEAHLAIVWFLLTAASALTPLYAGFIFIWFTFFGAPSAASEPRPADPSWNMKLAMVLMAFGCIAIGVFPGALYALLPFPVDFVPYTASHVVFQLHLLLGAAVAFVLLFRWLKRTGTITLDVDWLWRGVGTWLTRWADAWAGLAWDNLVQAIRDATGKVMDAVVDTHGARGVMARTWSTGAMAFWMTLIFAAYLIFAYL